MNIVYVITALGVGGAENLLTDACAELIKYHNITIIYLKNLTDYKEKAEKSGVKCIFADIDKLGIFKGFLRLRKIIKEENAHIIHTHLPLADTLGRLAALTCPVYGIFSTIHNSDLWKLKNSPGYLLLKLFNHMTVNYFRRCRLIAVSQSVKDFCIKREGIRESKISVVYNFADFENPVKTDPDFIPPLTQNCFTLINVARMEPNKGHMTLLEAVSLLVSENRIPKEKLRLILLGQGSERERLYDFVRTAELEDIVLFLGVRANVYDYLRMADLFVLPSQNEGQSIAVLEAFYCKTPVMASDIPANSEQLGNGENGILFPLSKGKEGLANAIQDFYEGNKWDTEKLKEKASEYCLSLTKSRHIDALENLYRSVLKQRGGKNGFNNNPRL